MNTQPWPLPPAEHTIADVLDRHVEWWDEDCREHSGCSCGWSLDPDQRVHVGEYPFDNSPQRQQWRAHLVQVLTEERPLD